MTQSKHEELLAEAGAELDDYYMELLHSAREDRLGIEQKLEMELARVTEDLKKEIFDHKQTKENHQSQVETLLNQQTQDKKRFECRIGVLEAAVRNLKHDLAEARKQRADQREEAIKEILDLNAKNIQTLDRYWSEEKSLRMELGRLNISNQAKDQEISRLRSNNDRMHEFLQTLIAPPPADGEPQDSTRIFANRLMAVARDRSLDKHVYCEQLNQLQRVSHRTFDRLVNEQRASVLLPQTRQELDACRDELKTTRSELEIIQARANALSDKLTNEEAGRKEGTREAAQLREASLMLNVDNERLQAQVLRLQSNVVVQAPQQFHKTIEDLLAEKQQLMIELAAVHKELQSAERAEKELQGWTVELQARRVELEWYFQHHIAVIKAMGEQLDALQS